jgi:hypothetical protein
MLASAAGGRRTDRRVLAEFEFTKDEIGALRQNKDA